MVMDVQYDATDDVLFVGTLGRGIWSIPTAAADLALTLGASGGIYIAGGIVPRLGEFFERSGFRRRFECKGRFSDYLAASPTFVITHDYPALLGLSTLAR